MIRASSISKIIFSKGSLTDTGKSYIQDVVRENILNCQHIITSKFFDKGNMQENESINLVNEIYFANYAKHSGRQTKGFLTGECDILTSSYIRDIKTSWDKTTFPFCQEVALKSATKSGYDWQLRAYMYLYDVDMAYLDYCLVDTPIELYREGEEINHIVDDVPLEMRITTLEFKRDEALEKQMLDCLKCAEDYYHYLITETEKEKGLKLTA